MKEGRKAPAFRLPDASGETVRLDDFHGRTVVLYFFPKEQLSGSRRTAGSPARTTVAMARGMFADYLVITATGAIAPHRQRIVDQVLSSRRGTSGLADARTSRTAVHPPCRAGTAQGSSMSGSQADGTRRRCQRRGRRCRWRSCTSLQTQRETIEGECAHRGWELLDVVTEDHSARSRRNPPLRQQVLDRLAAGQADVLMAAKLDRLSRSQHDFSGMLLAAEDQGWKVVVLDIGVDTTTSTGKMIAGVVVSIAEWESDRRSERIREVGTAGRRREVPDAVVTRIRRARGRGMSYQRIAANLNRDGVPGGRGGRWYAATVRSLRRSTGAR